MFLDIDGPGLTSKPVVSMSLSRGQLDLDRAASAKVGNSRRSTTSSGQPLATMISSRSQIIFLSFVSVDVGRPDLAGAQLPGDVVGDVRHHLLAGKRDAAFEDREDQQRERHRQQRELDRGAAAAVAQEARTANAPRRRASCWFGLGLQCSCPVLPILMRYRRNPSANRLRSGFDDRSQLSRRLYPALTIGRLRRQTAGSRTLTGWCSSPASEVRSASLL